MPNSSLSQDSPTCRNFNILQWIILIFYPAYSLYKVWQMSGFNFWSSKITMSLFDIDLKLFVVVRCSIKSFEITFNRQYCISIITLVTLQNIGTYILRANLKWLVHYFVPKMNDINYKLSSVIISLMKILFVF